MDTHSYSFTCMLSMPKTPTVNHVCLTPSLCCTFGPVSQHILNGLSSVTPSKTCGGAGGGRGRGVVKEGGWVCKNTQSFSHPYWTKSKTHTPSFMYLSACFVLRIKHEHVILYIHQLPLTEDCVLIFEKQIKTKQIYSLTPHTRICTCI